MLWADRGNVLVPWVAYMATIYVIYTTNLCGGTEMTDCHDKENSSLTVSVCHEKSTSLLCCVAADSQDTKSIKWYFKRPSANSPWVDLDNTTVALLRYERNRTVLKLKRVILGYYDGHFNCSVESQSGDVLSMSFNVIIKKCPPARRSPPGVTEPVTGAVIYVPRSGSTNVTCRGQFGSNHNPENRVRVSVTWVKDGTATPALHQEDREDEETVGSVLILSNVSSEDYGAYTCILRNQWGETNTSVVIKAPAFVLEPSLTIAISVVGSLVFVIIIAAATIYYWRLDILLFYKDRWRRLPIEENKTYDALVVYSEGSQLDHTFVLNSFLHELEDNHKFRLCLSTRDFLIGDLVLRNYQRSLDASQCVLAVVSPDFMTNPFCLYITDQVIAHERRHLVFLTLRPLVPAKTTNRQRERIEGAMRVGANVTWPSKESKRRLDSFWKRLRYKLPAPISSFKNNQKLDNG